MARRVLAKIVCDRGSFHCMRKLDLSHADMNLLSAEKVIEGLRKNKGIEELAVDNSIFTCGSARLGEDFTNYLRYASPKLKKLIHQAKPQLSIASAEVPDCHTCQNEVPKGSSRLCLDERLRC
ncbi:hypothetical protein MTO96_019116 [Rhipicephalus appendiculatus]